MIERFSSKLRKFQVFLIIVVAIGKVLFSGNTLWGDFPMTPQEAVKLVWEYGDSEEVVDDQLNFNTDPTVQKVWDFADFDRSLGEEALESDQSFFAILNTSLSGAPVSSSFGVGAVSSASHPAPLSLSGAPVSSSFGVGAVSSASHPASLSGAPVSSSFGVGAVSSASHPASLSGASVSSSFGVGAVSSASHPASLSGAPVSSSFDSESLKFWPEFWPEFWPNTGDGKTYAVAHVNAELASLTLTANTLLTNAIADRMISVKGCLADPFIHIIYGHAHQNKISGLGYNSHIGGFVMGLDDVWTFTDERYLRVGVVFGYAHGKTNFAGPAVSREKSARHNIYTIELFGAYEFFNDRFLKANVGVTIGYSRNDDRLHRADLSFNAFDARVRSDNFFMGIEFVKNLYAYKDYQFGLWLRANYSRIAQKEYDESTTAAVGAQHVSSVNHDFFTTIVGFNIEKEIPDLKLVDRKLTLSLKTGWECQAVRKYSEATISFDNNLGIGKFAPTFRHPLRSAAIVSLGASQKLNIHWSIVGSYIARFNKDISTHNLSVGAEYSF